MDPAFTSDVLHAQEPGPLPKEEPTGEQAPAVPTGGAGAAVKERPAPSRGKVEQLPPWRVLLHNADEPTMEYVVATLVELTPLNTVRAFAVMMEAHKTGVSLVLVTHRERAELYRDQFQSKQLPVTIEPAE